VRIIETMGIGSGWGMPVESPQPASASTIRRECSRQLIGIDPSKSYTTASPHRNHHASFVIWCLEGK
jgi:hypothetical protein